MTNIALGPTSGAHAEPLRRGRLGVRASTDGRSITTSSLARVETDSRPHATMRDASDLRSFLIADVRGYTRFIDERGNEAASQLAGRFAGLTCHAVAEYGGTLLELRGDEAPCVFSSARQAIRAAVELQYRFRERKDRTGGRLASVWAWTPARQYRQRRLPRSSPLREDDMPLQPRRALGRLERPAAPGSACLSSLV